MPFQRLMASPFARNLSTVFSGAALAQIIAFTAAPILSRLYEPSQFGMFGVFASICGTASAIASMSYEQGIMLTACDREVWTLQKLSLRVSLGMATATSFAVWLALQFSPSLFLGIHPWVWVAGSFLAIFCYGSSAIFQIHASRKKLFRQVSASMICRTTVTTIVQCNSFALMAMGLVLGAVLGHIASLFPYASIVRDNEKSTSESPMRSMRELAKEYSDFPKFTAPQNLMSSLGQHAPVLLLAMLGNATAAGAYLMTAKLLQRPMGMVIGPLRQVFYQHASETYRSNPTGVAKLFYKTTLVLAALIAIPSLTILVWGPQIFTLVLGPNWSEAGDYARWLIVGLSVGFMNLPAVIIARILQMERQMLAFNSSVLILRLISLTFGCLWGNALVGVAAFSIVGAVANGLLIHWVGIKVREPHLEATADS